MSKKANPSALIITDLKTTLQRLFSETNKPDLSTAARRSLETEIREVMDELAKFLSGLDPIRQPVSVFDPGNPKIVGRFISLALVAQPRHPLSQITRFYGSGIYAIYYTGSFPLYARLSGTETPIYVGQAAPAVNNARTPTEQGDRLCRRLEDHRKNISKTTTTLDINDFEFRSLVVQSGWETAAEDYMIHLFRPIWNNETKILYGLGKHGDDADTRSNKRSPWDVVHPGRPWAANINLPDSKTCEQITEEIAAHFEAHPIFRDLDAVLSSFIKELSQV
ncbi:MAG: Eco29kI family restriction endonuclease [Methanothrix sp.]|nr:Eco29kI family restriction endonuclease [Methanothrix sp.]